MPSSSTTLVPAVDRAVRILVALRGVAEGRTITELARELDIPKSSAFQIAATLVHHGLLECDAGTRRYRLGAGLARLAGVGSRPDVSVLAAPHLRELASRTSLTALLGLFSRAGTVLAARAASPEPLAIAAPVGFELERWAGAFGKVYAAALEPPQRRALLRRGLPTYTERSIVEAARMERELDEVLRAGVARDDEEYLDGVRAVAAPVRDAGDVTVGAVCALGVAARLPRERMEEVAAHVRAAAAALSRDLGAGDVGREVA